MLIGISRQTSENNKICRDVAKNPRNNSENCRNCRNFRNNSVCRLNNSIVSLGVTQRQFLLPRFLFSCSRGLHPYVERKCFLWRFSCYAEVEATCFLRFSFQAVRERQTALSVFCDKLRYRRNVCCDCSYMQRQWQSVSFAFGDTLRQRRKVVLLLVMQRQGQRVLVAFVRSCDSGEMFDVRSQMQSVVFLSS